MSFTEQAREYILEHQLLAPKSKYLLGVSGGVDSVVLAHLFKDMGVNFAVAHANFALRGEESDEDQEFVSGLAQQLKVECFVQRFDTAQVAEKKGISVQMAARELRHTWFRELMEEHGFAAVVLAHHHDDRIETFFINLVRGTGPGGLLSIQPRSQNIIRPLLFANKKDIRNHAKANKYLLREDSSNDSLKYKRNVIRKTVIPPLLGLNPAFRETMSDNIAHLQGVFAVFQESAESFRNKVVRIDGEEVLVNIAELRKTDHLLPFLFEILSPFGFKNEQLREIARSLAGQSGAEYLSADYKLTRDRQYLRITTKQESHTFPADIAEGQLEVNAPVKASIEVRRAANYSISSDPDIGQFDLAKAVFPLHLRAWQAGDRFIPFGMTKYKKVSDLLIDLKVPRNKKDRICVLLSENEIIWVVGLRIANTCCITEATKNILRITLV